MSSLTYLRDEIERLPLVSRLRRGNSAARADPSVSLFTGIRHRLTLWYTGVLAVILIAAGLLLYVGMQTVLLGPVTDALQREAQREAQVWQAQGVPPPSCSPFGRLPNLVACFDPSGNLIGSSRVADLATSFLSPSLARTALASASSPAIDTVTWDTTLGTDTIRRYAVVVQSTTGHQTLGVVQVGLDIEPEVHALNILVELLLLVGGLTLLGSGIGGIVLAHRALAPARLALARQQAFTADASHELRTPLTLLRADAEVLLGERDQLAPDDAALLDDIVAEAEHLGTLAANLLTLARLDGDAYHMEREVVDLGEVAANVAHRVRALAEQNAISVTVESEGETLVIGDRTWLGQAALILVDNAIKYNRTGGAVTLRPYLDRQHAVLEVRDTGVGIAAADLPHLGERFYRVDKARSREMGGAGLGLSIARGIAAAHRGSLTFVSAPGEGTMATLSLPAAGAPKR